METPPVDTVYVMFKCHVDLGFTDTEQRVIRRYIDDYLPQAIRVGRELRDRGGDERLVWTVPSWILHEFFSQAPAEAVTAAEEAIAAGDLSWHALPFTWYTELLDRSSVRASLSISQRLDERFGRRTTAARLTDVPGHTRGLIGPLVDAGVSFLDIGCNPGCRPPAVPFAGADGVLEPTQEATDPDMLRHLLGVIENPSTENLRFCVEGENDVRTHLFRWEDPDGKQLTVLYHPHGYGSTVRLPGTRTALSMRIHGDNLGPHSVEAVDAAYASLRTKFPGARIIACDLSTIGDVVAPLVPQLPVLTQEIGDTWIYDTGADPAKTSAFRELLRLRQEWLDDKRIDEGDDTDVDFLGALIPAPEHNWGLSTSSHVRRWDTYRVEELASARSAEFSTVDSEWEYKRQRPMLATDALPEDLRQIAVARLDRLRPAAPNLDGLAPADEPVLLRSNGIEATVSGRDGSLRDVLDTRTGRRWTFSGGLAVFAHQTFNADDYAHFNAQYNTAEFAYFDFGKPGLADYSARAGTWRPDGAQLWTDPTAGGSSRA